jgi:hypothetical protein
MAIRFKRRNNLKQTTYEDIQAYRSKCVNAKEVGERLKTLGNEECEELIRICKAFDCELYELTHKGNNGDEWLVTCAKMTKTRFRRQTEALKKMWEIAPWAVLRQLFRFRLKSYMEGTAAKENEELRQEIQKLKQDKTP